MDLDFKVEISPDVLAQEISGETVLLDLASESYFGLGTTATRIWQLLHEDRSVAEIHRTLAAEFDADPEVLRNDLLKHLQELESAGLIRIIRR